MLKKTLINYHGTKQKQLKIKSDRWIKSGIKYHKLKPRQSNSDQTYPTALIQGKKFNETMVFQTINNRQCRTLVSERDETVWTLWLSQSFCLGKSFQFREENPDRGQQSTELRRQSWDSWEFREVKAAKVHRAETRRGESYTKSELQRSAEASTCVFSRALISTCIWLNYSVGWGWGSGEGGITSQSGRTL